MGVISKLLVVTSVSTNYSKFIFLLFMSAVLLCVGCDEKKYVVTVNVINKSSETISDLSISIYGKKHKLGTLKIGGEAEFKYEVGPETEYKIEWIVGDGELITNNLGYVTRGMNKYDQILIRDGAAEFSIKEFY